MKHTKKVFIKIRPANKKDLPMCEKLYALPELACAACADGHNFSAKEMEDYIDDDFFLVAEDNNQVIGSIFGEKLKANGVMLWLFAVDKKYKGTGVGTNLLSAFEDSCKKHNVTWIILHTLAKNKETKLFYKNRGFNLGETYIEGVKKII